MATNMLKERNVFAAFILVKNLVDSVWFEEWKSQRKYKRTESSKK